MGIAVTSLNGNQREGSDKMQDAQSNLNFREIRISYAIFGIYLYLKMIFICKSGTVIGDLGSSLSWRGSKAAY